MPSKFFTRASLAIPAATAGLGAALAWGDSVLQSTELSFGLPLVLAGGTFSASFALLTAYDNHRLRARLRHAERLGEPAATDPAPLRSTDEAHDREDEARRLAHLRRLEREVEKLAAMRELSLIANDDTDFREVLSRALPIIRELFEATEIQVFLNHESTPQLAAVHRKRKTRFAEEGCRPLRGSYKAAREVLQARRGKVRLNSKRLMAVAILRADLEPIGAIAVFIPTRDRDDEWARVVLGELDELAKHIALVIAKPALYDRAVLDALTGLYSKRHFLEQTPRAMSAARRLSSPLAMIVVDIDRFKLINDGRGHVAGDRVLAEISRRIRSSIRDYDSAFRFGGEEICILAPNCGFEAALRLAERIRAAIEESPVIDQSGPIPVTASLGVASFKPTMNSTDDLVAEADRWLYRAKEEGRNQVRPRKHEVAHAPEFDDDPEIDADPEIGASQQGSSCPRVESDLVVGRQAF